MEHEFWLTDIHTPCIIGLDLPVWDPVVPDPLAGVVGDHRGLRRLLPETGSPTRGEVCVFTLQAGAPASDRLLCVTWFLLLLTAIAWCLLLLPPAAVAWCLLLASVAWSLLTDVAWSLLLLADVAWSLLLLADLALSLLASVAWSLLLLLLLASVAWSLLASVAWHLLLVAFEAWCLLLMPASIA
ncbi:unnamed protein product [Arctogadus glacialis]